MASIWIQEPGAKEPRKVKGFLDPAAVVGLFKSRVAKVARSNPVKVTAQTDMEALFVYTDGKAQRFSMFIEPLSPPSAPEQGQPVIKGGKGVVIAKDGTVHALPVPKGPPEKEEAK